MEIRELKAKDVKTLAKMLGKLKYTSMGDILALIDKQKNNNGKLLEVGLYLFRIIAADLTDDIYAWLADLIGKKPEELDEMPVNTPIEIIKELTKRGEFKNFFDLAIQQAGKDMPDSTIPSSPGTTGQTES